MKKLIVIAGPTASGKSALSIKLAKHFTCEIINADSRQFYRLMDIGTAKLRDLDDVPHHFIDSHNVTEKYNIGRFETDSLKTIENIFQKYDKAILTGGSGLYIDAVCNGIDELPESSVEVRENLTKLYQSEGIEALQKRLKEIDPEYYINADLNNPHRLMRALEVTIVSGTKYSALRKKNIKVRNFIIKKIGVLIDRDELYERINQRVDDMINKGLVNEVESLLPYRNENALQTVGYKEIFDYLDKKTSLSEAVKLIKQNSRNYAKRQMTWFRRDKEMKWFEPHEIDKMIYFISG